MSRVTKRALAVIALLPILLLVGCPGRGRILDGDGMERTYRQVSQEEAVRMMEQEESYILLDVRTHEEYEEAHIPGAICVPNETIGEDEIPELPDRQQLILVYCRSGRRSKEAAQKLFDMGYVNVVEFGGIITWPGETVSGRTE